MKKNRKTVSKAKAVVVKKTAKKSVKRLTKRSAKKPIKKSKGPASRIIEADVPVGAREKILTVARGLFAHHGFNGVSVRDISKASGLNLSLVSYYFGGKEGLYKAIIEQHVTEVEKTLREMMTLEKDLPMNKVRFSRFVESVIRIFFESRLQNPEMSAIMQRERFSGLPYAREVHEKIFGPFSRSFFEFMDKAREAKVVREDVKSIPFFVCLLESVMGYFSFMECDLRFTQEDKGTFKFPQDKDDFIRFLTRTFTEGIFK